MTINTGRGIPFDQKYMELGTLGIIVSRVQGEFLHNLEEARPNDFLHILKCVHSAFDRGILDKTYPTQVTLYYKKNNEFCLLTEAIDFSEKVISVNSTGTVPSIDDDTEDIINNVFVYIKNSSENI